MKQNYEIFYALTYWANWIETRDILLCREDALKQKKKVPELNSEQVKKVEQLRNLAQKALNGKIIIKE